MKRFVVRAIAVALVLGLAGICQTSEAQLLKRLKKKAQDKVEDKLGEKQDRAIDKALDGEEADEEGEDAESAGVPATAGPGDEVPAAKLKPGHGAWANYDFIPGERALFVDDFSSDIVGNFPQRLEFKSGNMEIVEWGGQRWLRAEGGEFYINLPEVLPDRFTMEFELAGSGNAMEIRLTPEAEYDHGIQINAHSAYMRSGGISGEGELGVHTNERPVKIRIAMDGKYLKLYADEKRALNVPNADFGRSDRLYVYMNGWSAEEPRLVSDIRIMAGGRKLYDAIAAEGRVVTQGILFDTGSDKLRPESTPTLKEIGQMLKDHPELRLGIEGHTDNVGSAETNKSLSERRAASVKAFLVEAYGVEASRIEASGFGPEKPVAANDSPEGRQMNRRVELVKL